MRKTVRASRSTTEQSMKLCHRCLLVGVLALSGCAAPALRSQSPEDFSAVVESTTRLIGEVARPFGHTYVKVESVALSTGLDNTGADPPPSPQRSTLLHELQTIGVQNPNQLLASPTTALVLVRGFLPPGVQKGDKFDLEVQAPPRQRRHQPARRLADGNPHDRNGGRRRASSRRPYLGQRRGGGSGRPVGRWRQGQCHAAARAGAGRRHGPQVARLGIVHLAGRQIDSA